MYHKCSVDWCLYLCLHTFPFFIRSGKLPNVSDILSSINSASIWYSIHCHNVLCFGQIEPQVLSVMTKRVTYTRLDPCVWREHNPFTCCWKRSCCYTAYWGKWWGFGEQVTNVRNQGTGVLQRLGLLQSMSKVATSERTGVGEWNKSRQTNEWLNEQWQIMVVLSRWHWQVSCFILCCRCWNVWDEFLTEVAVYPKTFICTFWFFAMNLCCLHLCKWFSFCNVAF